MYEYKSFSEIDGYCSNCVGHCVICGEQFHPKYKDKWATPLDQHIKDLIDDDWEDVLGEDAKDGDSVEICKSCRRKWRQRNDESCKTNET